jgi:hypothetical protein
MPAPDGSRLRIGFRLMLALSLGPVGCHRTTGNKTEQAASNAEQVKQSYADLKKQFADMQQSFSDLAKDLEAIPADLPGYARLRTNFYQAEEARGVTDAKVTMLSSRLESALKSGNPAELQQVSNDIAGASNDGRKIGEVYLKLLHEVLAFQRVADQSKAVAAAPAALPSPKTERKTTGKTKAGH